MENKINSQKTQNATTRSHKSETSKWGREWVGSCGLLNIRIPGKQVQCYIWEMWGRGRDQGDFPHAKNSLIQKRFHIATTMSNRTTR